MNGEKPYAALAQSDPALDHVKPCSESAGVQGPELVA